MLNQQLVRAHFRQSAGTPQSIKKFIKPLFSKKSQQPIPQTVTNYLLQSSILELNEKEDEDYKKGGIEELKTTQRLFNDTSLEIRNMCDYDQTKNLCVSFSAPYKQNSINNTPVFLKQSINLEMLLLNESVYTGNMEQSKFFEDKQILREELKLRMLEIQIKNARIRELEQDKNNLLLDMQTYNQQMHKLKQENQFIKKEKQDLENFVKQILYDRQKEKLIKQKALQQVTKTQANITKTPKTSTKIKIQETTPQKVQLKKQHSRLNSIQLQKTTLTQQQEGKTKVQNILDKFKSKVMLSK